LEFVTIEVDEVVYYTSEEAEEVDEPDKKPETLTISAKGSMNQSQAALQRGLTRKRQGMGSGNSNRISTISGLSGSKGKDRKQGATINVSSQ